MLRSFSLGLTVLILAIGPAVSQESPAGKRVEIHKVKDIVTVWSIDAAPSDKAAHTYIITHGLGGVDDRFFDLGAAIRATQADVNVLVIDWTPGSDCTIARVPNPLAAANRIDLTGEVVGSYLTKLSKKKCFDPAQATFIGESFGNCINHRTAVCLRKNGLQKAERALVLNPAPCTSGYSTPLFTVAFKQSIACVSESWLDSRGRIANKQVLLKPDSRGQIEQHQYGMRWLQRRLEAGDSVATLFVSADSKK
jgi:hypothetical protein